MYSTSRPTTTLGSWVVLIRLWTIFYNQACYDIYFIWRILNGREHGFFKLLGSLKNFEEIDLKILFSRHLHGKTWSFFNFLRQSVFEYHLRVRWRYHNLKVKRNRLMPTLWFRVRNLWLIREWVIEKSGLMLFDMI